MAESGKLRQVAQIGLLYGANLHQGMSEGKKASIILCKLSSIRNIHVPPLIYNSLLCCLLEIVNCRRHRSLQRKGYDWSRYLSCLFHHL